MEPDSGLKEVLSSRLRSYAQKALSNDAEREPYISFKSRCVNPNVELALSKLYDGTYGLCEDCGEDIPAERLKIVPGAVRCVLCQEKAEKSHGSR